MRSPLGLLKSDNARGIALILCASAFAVMSSSFTKILASDFPSFQISFTRSCVTLLCLIPFIVRNQFRGLWPARPGLMALRSFNAAAIIMLNVYAVGALPLVDFTAIGFTTPVFVIILSVLIFRQTPELGRTIATLIGFAGVLMIVRPTGTLSVAMLAAFGGALCMGFGVLLIRLLSRTESQLRLLLWSNAVVVFLLAVPVLSMWVEPTPVQWGMFLASGLTGTLAQACILLGYEYGEPMVVAPFDYSRIILAVAAGLLLFAEIPDLYTFAGAALVISAGVYIARRKSPAATKP